MDLDIISLLVSLAALIATIWIPTKIKWEQRYSSLLDSYRSMDFAIAYQGIVEFFANDCHSDMEQVKSAYKKRFIEEITNKKGDINKDNCLHFQRRLLGQFFWQMNECAESWTIGKKRILRDFTSSDANLIKILIYMGDAVDGDDVLYKDISSPERIKNPRYLKGQNKALAKIYFIMKHSKRFMDIK